MKVKIIVATLLGLCVASQCIVTESLPATKYIDVTDLEANSAVYRRAFRDFVESRGSEDPDVTASLVGELAANLRQLEKGAAAEDKFGYRAQMDSGHIFTFSRLVQKVHNLTTDPDKYYSQFDFDQYLSLIKDFFGDDLEGFAKGEVNHDAKLQAYLSKSIKSILSKVAAEYLRVPHHKNVLEDGVARIVAHDLKPKHSEAELIGRAQEIDLLNGEFDAKSMLHSVETVDYAKLGMERPTRSARRLEQTIKDICSGFSIMYGPELLAYTWARLMIPEELSQLALAKDLPRLAELWRVCLPVNNPHTCAAVAENLKKNLSLKERVKKMF